MYIYIYLFMLFIILVYFSELSADESADTTGMLAGTESVFGWAGPETVSATPGTPRSLAENSFLRTTKDQAPVRKVRSPVMLSMTLVEYWGYTVDGNQES